MKPFARREPVVEKVRSRTDPRLVGRSRKRPPSAALVEALETRIAPALVTGTVNLSALGGGKGFPLTSGVTNGSLGINVADIGDINGDGFDDVIATPSRPDLAPAIVIFGQAGGFPLALNAGQLDGSNGFRIGGVFAAAQRIGDFDGDGIDDLLVGDASNAYLIRGHTGTFAADLNLATLDGANGFKVTGLTLPPGVDQSSIARLLAGADVNGDGFADLIIPGSSDADVNVIFGRTGAFPASFAASTISGSVGFKIGGNDSEFGGTFVAGLGDINGDGFDEIALKSSSAGGGHVFVIFGHGGAFSNIGIDPLSTANGFTITTTGTSSVGAAGDVNGDGFADIIVGKPGGTAGAAVIYGKAAAFSAVVDPAALTVADGFRIVGAVSDNLGGVVEGTGDVNADGFADVIVSATGVGGTGGAYVIFGKATRTSVDFNLASLAAADGFLLVGGTPGDFTGTSVAGGGDVNGDGFADVIVSSTAYDGGGLNSGAAYVVFGGPSGALVNPTTITGKTATFTDVDGDLVTVKVSKGTLTNANFQLIQASSGAIGAQLLSLTLPDDLTHSFDGANVSITAKRAAGGDGKVNVGFIDATGVDLGAVKIGGDLGKIVAGDTTDDIAVKRLTVGSLGLFGGRTGDTGTGLVSTITGPVGAVKIAGDVDEAAFIVGDAVTVGSAKIASFALGGNLTGGARAASGYIQASAIGSMKVGGDFVGGRGLDTAFIFLPGNLGSLTVGGSLLGGEGAASASVGISGVLGAASIAGDLRGSSGLQSARIAADGGIGALKIGGSQLAGAGAESALIFSPGNIASVSIGGDATSSAGAFSGGILAGTLGPVTIKGDVTGTVEQPYLIRGSGPESGTKSVAIASIKVGGDFDHALVLGGYGGNNVPENGHAQIGAISVGGDWIASSVSAGLLTNAGATKAVGSFGNGDDAFILDGATHATSAASIKSVTIKGAARGTFEDGDRYAIVAEQIGSVKIGGAKLALTKGTTANDLAAIHVGATPDFVVREVSRTTAAPADTFTATPAAGLLTAIPAAIGLGTLASADGFKLSGVGATDRTGNSVSNAGDVNGDGFDDFIVGAYLADEGSNNRGAAYVVFGQAGGLGSFNASALNGTNGFKLVGGEDGDYAGSAVGAAGDVNGDGFADLIVAGYGVDADHNANPDENRGAAYVVFGRSSFASVGTAGLTLSTLDGTDGFRLLAVLGEGVGRAVSGAGDVNGDGFDDVLVGARFFNTSTGAAYVVFGKSRFASAPTPGFTIGLDTLDGSNGFKLAGEDILDEAGTSVSGAGDVNGDGFADVIVGARGAEEAVGSNRGAAYVVFGRSSFTSTPAAGFSLGLGTLQGTDGFKLTGVADNDLAGFSVGGAGDVNGDGFADVIVGAEGVGNSGPATDGTGAAYVVFGRSNFVPGPVAGFSIGLGTLDGATGFKLGGIALQDYAGSSVSGAGDVNGDGFADLVVGASGADEATGSGGHGAAYVVFGKSRFTGTPAAGFTIGLGTLDGANGFKLFGEDLSNAGSSVKAAGDVNGDGFGDVIVGAIAAGGGINGSGAAYVIYGGPSGEFIDLDPTHLSTDGHTATWTDVDGDAVTLKISGTTAKLTNANFKLLAKSTADSRAQLLSLSLGSEFDGANVSITAKRAGGGDGKVNVGTLDAVGVDLGAVTVGGDLGSFRSGDVDAGLAFKSLTVGSLGVFGARTQDTGGQLLSSTSGPAGALKILGDVRDAAFAAITSGVQPGSLASVTIGGDLSGTGPLLGPSNLFLLGQVGPGTIAASNTIGPVKVGGDIVGGRAANSGYLFAGSVGNISLGGSLVGGGGLFSGAIIGGTLGNVSIGGSQIGGAGLGTGYLAATSGIGKVSIKHDQIGGGTASGLIFTQDPGANIASVTIGGDARGGDALFSGGILAGGTLGPVSIKGDVIGTPKQAYLIRGSGPLTGTKSVAITSLRVGGDFDHALILAGYGANNVPTNGHAQIGAISVGGDWIASSVTAGLLTSPVATSAVGLFGNGDDTFIPLPNPTPPGFDTVVASIASITIKGRAMGSFETGDFFGIVAEQIGSVTLGGVKLAFSAANKTDGFFVGPTPDFVIGEVARF